MDTIMGPFIFNARITVFNECSFKNLMSIVVIQMMDNSITEIRRKYFSLFGVINSSLKF